MTRILRILLTLPLAAAFADTIKLKSGEVLQGHVVNSDTKSVTFDIQFSPTIVDQQTYARTDIADLSVEAGDETAFARIREIKTPDTALSPKDCQSLIDSELAPFLKQYPASPRKADVQRQIAAMRADLARLNAGDIKVSGAWYDKGTQETEKYQIEAATLLEAMKQQIDAKNFPTAMNSYTLLQRSYQNSMAFVEAVPLATKAVASLQQQLNFAIGNLPETKALRQTSIDRTPIEDRPPIQRAIDAENARAAATALLAQKNNEQFFTIFPFDETGLKAMLTASQQTETQLAAIDSKKFEQAAQLVRRADQELASHHLAAAGTTLDELKTAWPEYEGLNRMEQQLQAAQTADKASEVKEKAAANLQ